MNLLITSAGRRSYLVRYFKNELDGKGKVFASNSEYSIALQEADGYFISPLIYDSLYVDSLISYCKKNNIDSIISVFDIDLLILAKSKYRIEKEGIKLLLSNQNVVETCNDKWESYNFLTSLNIQTPKTFKKIDDVINALDKGQIKFPIIIKPRWGMASIGVYSTDTKEELYFYGSKASRVIKSSYLKYESNITPNEAVLYQEQILGQEYGLDIINDFDGNFIGVFPKAKVSMRAGETDIGQTVSPNKFMNIAKILSQTFKHSTILSVDCIESNKILNVIEMNCRISGHYPVSHIAGINLPKQILEWLEGKATNWDNFKFREGVIVTKDLNPIQLNSYDIN